MKFVKGIVSLLISVILTTVLLIPNNMYAQTSKVEEILLSMSNEDKIAMMIMP